MAVTIESLEHECFLIEMKDHWSRQDEEKLRELKAQIIKLKKEAESNGESI